MRETNRKAGAHVMEKPWKRRLSLPTQVFHMLRPYADVLAVLPTDKSGAWRVRVPAEAVEALEGTVVSGAIAPNLSFEATVS